MCSSYAHEKNITLVESTLNRLNVAKENCLIPFIKIEKLNDSESVILIPEIAEKGDGFTLINAYLVIEYLRYENGTYIESKDR